MSKSLLSGETLLTGRGTQRGKPTARATYRPESLAGEEPTRTRRTLPRHGEHQQESFRQRAYLPEWVSLSSDMLQTLSEFLTEDFAAFPDQQLKDIKPVSLKPQRAITARS